MQRRSNASVLTAAGLSAVMASLSGTALALLGAGGGSVALAAPADGQDINNDWGQTAEEVAAEIAGQVAADPAVIDAQAVCRKALRAVDARRSAVKAALRDYRHAKKTKSHRDDRRTKRALANARRALTKSVAAADDANPYGTMQVQIVVTNSVITAVTTPVYPKTGDSKDINAKALPKLQQEAIVAQSSKIASVSGATYSSKAFKQSLQSAIVLAGLPG